MVTVVFTWLFNIVHAARGRDETVKLDYQTQVVTSRSIGSMDACTRGAGRYCLRGAAGLCLLEQGRGADLRLSEAKLMGKSLGYNYSGKSPETPLGRLCRDVRTGKTRYGAGDVLAVPALRKDGARISIEFTVLPFPDRGGRILGIAAILRDVTKRFEEVKALRKELAAQQRPRGSRVAFRIAQNLWLELTLGATPIKQGDYLKRYIYYISIVCSTGTR